MGMVAGATAQQFIPIHSLSISISFFSEYFLFYFPGIYCNCVSFPGVCCSNIFFVKSNCM